MAYYLLTRHPGSALAYYGNLPNSQRERVPADEIVLYNNLAERAEQEVGFTELNSIIRTVHQNSQYTRALTLTSIATCFKPFWIKRTFPTGMTYNAEEFGAYMGKFVPQITGAADGSGGGVRGASGVVGRQQGVSSPTEIGRPAETKLMNWGEELMQTSANFPVEAAHEFRSDNDHEAAVGAGVAYTEWTGRFDNMGFMAARLSRMPSQQNYRVRQQDMIEQVVRPELREQLRAGIMTGEIPLPMKRLDEFVMAANFIGTRWESANPLADMQTMVLGIGEGILTRQQVQNALPDGLTVEEMCAAIASEDEMLADHGIVIGEEQATAPTLAEAPATAPKTPGKDDDTIAAPSKKRPANPVRRNNGNGHSRIPVELLTGQF